MEIVLRSFRMVLFVLVFYQVVYVVIRFFYVGFNSILGCCSLF